MVKPQFLGLLGLLLGFNLACKSAPQAQLAPLDFENLETIAAEADPAIYHWVVNNDRKSARMQLYQTLLLTPDEPQLWLRRLMLDLTEMREDFALEALDTLLSLDPNSPESEAALHLVRRNVDRLLQTSKRLAILKKHGLDDPKALHRPETRWALFSLGRATDSSPAHQAAFRKQEGAWDRMRVLGPLSEEADRFILADPDPLETARHWPASAGLIRELDDPNEELPIGTGNTAKRYIAEAWIELKSPKALRVRLTSPTSFRFWVNDQLVASLDRVRQEAAPIQRVNLSLPAGWHRLRMAVQPESLNERFSVRILDMDGKLAFDDYHFKPSAMPSTLAEVQVLKPLQDPRASALRMAEAMAREPESAIFGELLLARIRLSWAVLDTEAAEVGHRALQKRWPHSAEVARLSAELMRTQSLPQSRIQAALDVALRLDPSLPLAQWQMAKLLAPEQPERAAKGLAELEKSQPGSLAGLDLGFDLNLTRGWAPEAFWQGFELVKAAPESERFEALSQLLRDAGRLSEAKHFHERSLAELKDPLRRKMADPKTAGLDSTLREIGQSSDLSLLAQGSELAIQSGKLDLAKALIARAHHIDPLNPRWALAELNRAVVTGDAKAVNAAQKALLALGGGDIQTELWVEPFGLSPLLEAESAFDPWPYIKPKTPGGPPRGLDPEDPLHRHERVNLWLRNLEIWLPNQEIMFRHHRISRLQTKGATDQAGELDVSSNLLPIQVRTLKADGRTVAADRHAGKRDLSFSELAPGDAIETEFLTRRPLDVVSPDNGVAIYPFQDPQPTLNRVLEIRVPESETLWTHSYHGAPEPEVEIKDGMRRYLWTQRGIAAAPSETHSAVPTAYIPFVAVMRRHELESFERRFVGSLHSMSQASVAVTEQAKAITQPFAQPEQKLRALFSWIHENINPGPADLPRVVLARGRGIRSGLFVAMARAIGFNVDLVLLEPPLPPTGGPRLPAYPESPLAWVHLESGESRLISLDAAQSYGKLQAGLVGGRLLWSDENGELKSRAITADMTESLPVTTELNLDVDARGGAKGVLSLRIPGALASQLRAFLAQAEAQQKQGLFAHLVSQALPGAVLVKDRVLAVSEALADLVIQLDIEVPRFMQRLEPPDGPPLLGTEHPLPQSLGSTLGLLIPIQSYLTQSQRQTPMQLRAQEARLLVNLRFASKASALLEKPEDYEFKTPYGHFSQRFQWHPRQGLATLKRTSQLPHRSVSPETYPEVYEAFSRLLQAQHEALVLSVE